ncbi:MAG: hypothetical protein LC624_09170 [Halobacteriales archaeon]|nr:hypothetical protein [Halobacteriales archaeon]
MFLGLPDLAWEALSYVSFVLLLGAFGASAWGKLARESDAYFGANAVGSFILALYSAKLGSPALTLLEGAWCAMAVGGWVHARRKLSTA